MNFRTCLDAVVVQQRLRRRYSREESAASGHATSPSSPGEVAAVSTTDRRSRDVSARAAAVLVTIVTALVAVLGPASPASAVVPRREIVNASSGLRADVMWASQNPFQQVFLWPNNTSSSQDFDLLYSDDTWFRIRARHSGQCLMLDWRGGSYVNGTPVIQYPYCDAEYGPAEWRVKVLSGTRCSGGVCHTGVDQQVLVNRQTDRCLDAANPSSSRPPVRALLQQWDCAASTDAWNIRNQAWNLLEPGTIPLD